MNLRRFFKSLPGQIIVGIFSWIAVLGAFVLYGTVANFMSNILGMAIGFSVMTFIAVVVAYEEGRKAGARNAA